MRVTALVQDSEHVCCRYRLEAFRPYLERAGHELEVRPLPRRPWEWFRLGGELADADLVVWQRKLLASWKLFLLRRAARRLCFDFDDAVFLRDSFAPKGMHSARRRRAFDACVRTADVVIAGNAFLRDQALFATTANRIAVIPTCIDPSQYRVADHKQHRDGVELVWIGSSSTLQALERIQPWLEMMGQRWTRLRLKLICDRFLPLRHLPVLNRRWSEETETQELASADIGISWLPNDLWSRGKCGLKVLQYMAAGLPVVANPVGVQTALVRHGETGFLAETPRQWLVAVGRLARDPELRRRMGQAGRRRVERFFAVAVGARHWLALLRHIEEVAKRAG